MINKKAMTVCLLLLAALVVTPVMAQQRYSQRQTQKLKGLSNAYTAKYKTQRARAYARALKAKLPLRVVTKDRVIELQGFSRPNGGTPLYFTNFNLNAARTISTDKVQAQLGLTGTGIVLGIWDGGKVRTTHQEFGNRVTQQDNATTLSSHATHVAGTMGAAGVSSNAKGMAPNATIHAYDWNSDLAEMANAASNGLLLSNHSYGFITGWAFSGSGWRWYGDVNISTTEDYRFGFYSDYSKDMDQIAFDAPFYLICKAAGNDRNDNHSGSHQYYNGTSWVNSTAFRKRDGDYDCIGAGGVAKNILTIGAVNDISSGYSQPSDVVQTSFSSWGPTDDGRIKPDLVANGASLFSPDSGSDTDYGNKSGTSMSSPSVTGSLGLLQQHYKNKNGGSFMRAATLKALVIHTADEAGNANGPDYSNGWGLMNTKAAADVITNRNVSSKIEEETLNNNGTYSIQVNATGNEPLVATIVWTDAPGTPTAPALDPTNRMLVNDLDLRLSGNGNTYQPWILNPANPSAAATKGDNDRDNVEKVFIANPGAGTYTITVNHKGALNGGNQAFSIIVTGITTGSSACAVAGGLTTSNLATTSATLNWSAVNGATTYDVRYRAQGSANWATVNGVNGTSTNVSGLVEGTTYEFQVRTNCSNGSSAYSASASFTTGTPASCITAFPYNESFETGLGAWVQSSADDINWTRQSGGTASNSTGPSAANNGSFYMYVEASGSNYPAKTATLISPCFDLSAVSSPTLKFDYHMYGSQVNNLKAEVSTNGSSWAEIFNKSGDQGNSWTTQTIDLNAYKGSNVSVRFTVTTGTGSSGWQSDIAIDHVRVEASTPPLVYCASEGNNSTEEYIGRVQLGSIDNSSNGSNGYTDFTSTSTSLAQGSSNTITITPVWTGTVYNEGYSVWIDFNRDGDFTDAGEQVFTQAATRNTPVSGTINIPTSVTTGSTRMRVSMRYNAIPTSCGTFNYGEVEDYTINIAPSGTATFASQTERFPILLEEVSVSPNPATDVVTVKAQAANNSQVSFTLVSINGRSMMRKVAQANNGEATQQFKVGNLPKGIYLIKVQTKGGQKIQKVVVR
ncbi:S8 family serine peptidase [Microscilla marina]|uniref:MAM domain protein n=1 Tax=Microscilla marina ATCC 23134 TaxID=313606 RepID=A1ZDI2_MICM2|nr:S8 family serine peptidase [Microscilla marina]EAY31721.1 MAM domain protein [Microscilla marina ATCC 23134]